MNLQWKDRYYFSFFLCLCTTLWAFVSHLWGDNLYRCHEAISDDGHSQEHVHEWHKVDHGPCYLGTEPRLSRLPHGQENPWSAHGHIFTFLFARRRDVGIWRGGRGRSGEDWGWDCSQVGVTAGVAVQGHGLTGRQLLMEEDQEVKDGDGWREERHGDLWFPRDAARQGREREVGERGDEGWCD